jgi:hypothetical protein
MNSRLITHGLTYILFFFCLSFTAHIKAQTISDEVAKTSTTTSVPATQQAKATSVQAKQTQDQNSTTKSDIHPPKAATNRFDADKEARLESLRYKHLWIAYSLVWLIIFGFMRATWKRGQSVENRLDELKTRLADLESQNNK